MKAAWHSKLVSFAITPPCATMTTTVSSSVLPLVFCASSVRIHAATFAMRACVLLVVSKPPRHHGLGSSRTVPMSRIVPLTAAVATPCNPIIRRGVKKIIIEKTRAISACKAPNNKK